MYLDKSVKNIKNMFNLIANDYDKVNDFISFGFHKIIKKKCIDFLEIKSESKVLDICTGTGDMIFYAQKYSKNIIGVDFSENMLQLAKNKLPYINFICADCNSLPFEDESFDIIIIAYGLRNIEIPENCIKEIYRVLKFGGKILHLDFGEKNFANRIFEVMTPLFAKILTDNPSPYKYLTESVKEFYTPLELIKLFELYGFNLLLKKDFLLKSVSCQIFVK